MNSKQGATGPGQQRETGVSYAERLETGDAGSNVASVLEGSLRWAARAIREAVTLAAAMEWGCQLFRSGAGTGRIERRRARGKASRRARSMPRRAQARACVERGRGGRCGEATLRAAGEWSTGAGGAGERSEGGARRGRGCGKRRKVAEAGVLQSEDKMDAMQRVRADGCVDARRVQKRL